MDFDWKSIVKTVAPMLGTALGGPFGGIAGSLISKALGTPDAKDDTLSAAIQNATPDQLAAIQKVENDFKIQMAQMGFQDEEALDKIAADDRASARTMEDTTQAKTPYIGFYLLTAGFFGLLGLMLFHGIPEVNKAVLYTMVGSLGTVWIQSANFLYGSNHMDADTKKMLYNSVPNGN